MSSKWASWNGQLHLTTRVRRSVTEGYEEVTVFECTETHEGRYSEVFLTDYRGFFVADAYAGHSGLYGQQSSAHHTDEREPHVSTLA